MTADGYCPGCKFNLEIIFRNHAICATKLDSLHLDKKISVEV